LTDKIINLSHLQFHQKNFTESINLFLDNEYPSDFIFSNISNRIKKLFHLDFQPNNPSPLHQMNKKNIAQYFILNIFLILSSLSPKNLVFRSHLLFLILLRGMATVKISKNRFFLFYHHKNKLLFDL